MLRTHQLNQYKFISMDISSVLKKFSASLVLFLSALTFANSASADDLPTLNPFMRYANPESAVLAVQTRFDAQDGHVHVSVYNSEEDFLHNVELRLEANLDETGFALISLKDLPAQDYSFVVYLDENMDGHLNRNFVGKPKEPFIFSNDVIPTLRKPTFKETSVAVHPGKVIVMTIKK